MRLFADVPEVTAVKIKQHLARSDQPKLKRGESVLLAEEEKPYLLANSYIMLEDNVYALAHDKERSEKVEVKQGGEVKLKRKTNRAVLGEGGFGRVKWVQSLATGLRHVVKIAHWIAPNEMAVLADLDMLLASGSNTKTIASEDEPSGYQQTKHYAVLKYVGTDLAKYVSNNSASLTEGKRLAIAIGFLLWIARFHAGHLSKSGKAYAHLDVKPYNACVDEHGAVTLIDFGLSKPYTSEPRYVFEGTPEYMPTDEDGVQPMVKLDNLAAKRSVYMPQTICCEAGFVESNYRGGSSLPMFLDKAVLEHNHVLTYFDTEAKSEASGSGIDDDTSVWTLAALLISANAHAYDLLEDMHADDTLAQAVIAIHLDSGDQSKAELQSSFAELKADRDTQQRLALLLRAGVESGFVGLVDCDPLVNGLKLMEQLSAELPDAVKHRIVLAKRRLMLAYAQKNGLGECFDSKKSLWQQSQLDPDHYEAIVSAATVGQQVLISFLRELPEDTALLGSAACRAVFSDAASLNSKLTALFAIAAGVADEAMLAKGEALAEAAPALCYLCGEKKYQNDIKAWLSMALNSRSYCQFITENQAAGNYMAEYSREKATILLALGSDRLAAVFASEAKQQGWSSIVPCMSLLWLLPLVATRMTGSRQRRVVRNNDSLKASLMCVRLFKAGFYNRPVVLALLKADPALIKLVRYLSTHCQSPLELSAYAQLIEQFAKLPSPAHWYSALFTLCKILDALPNIVKERPNAVEPSQVQSLVSAVKGHMQSVVERLSRDDAMDDKPVYVEASLRAMRDVFASLPNDLCDYQVKQRYWMWKGSNSVAWHPQLGSLMTEYNSELASLHAAVEHANTSARRGCVVM